MVGRAVLTTDPSNADSRMGMHSAMKHRQKPGPRTHGPEGAPEAVESTAVEEVAAEREVACSCEDNVISIGNLMSSRWKALSEV